VNTLIRYGEWPESISARVVAGRLVSSILMITSSFWSLSGGGGAVTLRRGSMTPRSVQKINCGEALEI
jgi:hypothetical protein